MALRMRHPTHARKHGTLILSPYVIGRFGRQNPTPATAPPPRTAHNDAPGRLTWNFRLLCIGPWQVDSGELGQRHDARECSCAHAHPGRKAPPDDNIRLFPSQTRAPQPKRCILGQLSPTSPDLAARELFPSCSGPPESAVVTQLLQWVGETS